MYKRQVVNGASMTYNSTDYKFYYTTPGLDSEGTWTASVIVTDADGATDTGSTTFQVVTISVNSLTVDPYNSTRPADFHLKTNVTCDDPTLTNVTYKVYNPSGSLFASGDMVYNSTDNLWHATVSVTTSDPVGFYDVTINATDPNASDEQTFYDAFRVDNIAPTVHWVNVYPSSVERGSQTTITVNATDPESSPDSLTVDVRLREPDGDEYSVGYASWNGSLYVKTWTPASNAQLGTWNAKAYVTDPDGDQAINNKTFSVINAVPDILSIYASSDTVYVGGSVWIYADVEDYESADDQLNVTITVYKGSTKITEGIMSYQTDLGIWKWAFNPTSTGFFDFEVTAKAVSYTHLTLPTKA